MDYFSKPQPIALSTTVEPCMSEKEAIARSESVGPPPNQTRLRRSRFKKALIVVAHLFLVGVFLRFVSHKLHKHSHQRDRHHGGHSSHDLEMFAGHDDDEDLECLLPAEWSDPEEIPTHHGGLGFSSNTSFTLPASSESLLFIAHGSYAFGYVTFIEDDTNTLASEDIAVDINVHYLTREALEYATICTLNREIGAGIGIFTQTERHRGRRHNELHFQISVRFPKSAEIQNLKTRLPLFHHNFPKTDVRFNSLIVNSSIFPIIAEDLIVNSGVLKTSNSVIKGNFTVTNGLRIISSNAPVLVNITMINADKETPTRVFVKTSNALLESNFALISTNSDETGGAFDVATYTSNSPVVVEFRDSPVDSILQMSAGTKNSPASVKLHPAYEGTFDLKTSIFMPRVDVDYDVEDPSGEGRIRKVPFNTVGKEMKGTVRWVSEGDGDDDDDGDTERMGSVKVVTSILPAHLKL